jgi:hypothetical protein
LCECVAEPSRLIAVQADERGECAGELSLTAVIEYVCNGIFIERSEEGVQRLAQHTLETSSAGDRACVGLMVEALHHT